jgi:hypothetical protein
MGNGNESIWPGAGVLLAGAVVLAAGYTVSLLRGAAPAAEVRVVMVPPPVVEAPAEP